MRLLIVIDCHKIKDGNYVDGNYVGIGLFVIFSSYKTFLIC